MRPSATSHPLLVLVMAIAALAVGAWLLSPGPVAVGGSLPPGRIAQTSVEPSPSSLVPEGSTAAGGVGTDSRRREALPSGSSRVRGREVLVRVRSKARAPVVGAHVYLASSAYGRAANTSGNAFTRSDSEGNALLARAPDHDQVIVVAPSHVPRWIEAVPEVPGRAEVLVTLDDEVSLSGRVTIAGENPGAAMELQLESVPYSAHLWSPAARAALEAEGVHEGRMRVSVAESGEFEVRGIPAGETVTLAAKAALGFARTGGGDARLTVVTPSCGLLVELVRLPRVTGTVRWNPPPTSAPDLRTGLLSGLPPSLALRWRMLHGERCEIESEELVVSGKPFALAITKPGLDRCELEVIDLGKERARLAQRRLLTALDRDLDVGEITVPEPERELHFVVRDKGGTPLQGVKVLIGGRVFGPSAEDGKILVTSPRSESNARVGAFGYRVREIELGGSPPPVVHVELEPSTRLVVRVKHVDPRVRLEGLRLALEIDAAWPRDAADRDPRFATVVSDAAPDAAEWSDTHVVKTYRLPLTGTLAFADLTAGVGIRARIEDGHGGVLARRAVVLEAAKPGSPTAEIELLIEQRPRQVQGIVRDLEGARLPNVTVVLGGNPFVSPSVTSDENGRFVFEQVWCEEGPSSSHAKRPLAILCDGYVDRYLPEASLEGTLELVLEPARTVWVDVVDARGNRVEAQAIYRSPEGHEVGGIERGVGRYELQKVPLRGGTLRAVGKTGAVQVGAQETSARLVVD